MNDKAKATSWVRYACLIGSLFISGSLLAAQNAAPFTSGARYDASGRVTGTILPDPDGDTGPLKFPATRHTYLNGLLTRTESGELAYWYDENTSPAGWPDAHFSRTLTKVFAYDHYGRKTVQATLDSPQGSAVTLVQYNYDAKGRVNCKAVRMNAGSYSSSNFSSLPAACSPVQHATGSDRVTRYTYDTLDQVLTETRAYGTGLSQVYVTNTYYPGTRLLETQADANGNVTKLQYDNTERLTSRFYPHSSPGLLGLFNVSDYNSYTYDANSNLQVERKRNGATITYGYDKNNRLITKNLSNNTYSADVFYRYDLRGLTLHSRFGTDTGQGITNTFDGFGNLATTTTTMGGNSRTLSYGYDKNSNRTRVTHPDNNYFLYTFDGINRVNAVTENATNMLSLTYQPNGRRQTITRDGSTTTYDFDDVGRLESLAQAFIATTNNVTNTFTYNAANQVTVLVKSNTQYDYIKNENRTGGYEVNGLNQYHKINGQPLGYDTNGNLTNDGTRTYVYDMENRLVSTSSGGVTSTLKYDPLGRLFETKIGTVTTQFLYDGDALVGEYSSLMGGGLRQRYVHGDQVDEPWVQYESGSVGAGYRRYLHADHQGSIIALSNTSGTVLNKLKYDSYGIPDTTNVERFGYTGQLWFKDLGLFHYKARMYSPKLGRFLQTDPIFYADQMNIYAYVGNDPVNNNDPTGKQTDPTIIDNILVTGVRPTGMSCIGCHSMSGADARAFAEAMQNSLSYALAISSGAGVKIWMANEDSTADSDSTEHGEERAEEAETDPNRQVGDKNKVIKNGKRYTDTDTGNTVYVDGDRVVVVNEKGKLVTQFKNTRKNTQDRLQSGRWAP